jgi:hypothetical protein
VENSFLVLGIACVVVAIVGGGLRVFSVDVPLISSSKRQVLLGLFGLILISPVVNPDTIIHLKCDRYSQVAIAQNTTNLKVHCGLSGSRWHDKYAGHYAWCLNQTIANPKYEIDTRKSALDNCSAPGSIS